MFSRIIVPLDGSKLAEAVLPYVRVFARAFDSKVSLLQAMDLESGSFPADLIGLMSEAKAEETRELARRTGEEYLARLEKTMGAIEVERIIGAGQPDKVIVEESGRDSATNLIAMSTHGRSGIGRWIVGSVTDKVTHNVTSSMLVVRPDGEDNQVEGEAHLRRIIVPLDGSEVSEKALPAAGELARKFSLDISLIRVVSTVQLSMAGDWPTGYPDVLGELENEARDYLGAKERELTTQGIDRVESQVVLGDTAAQIVDLARRYGESLVVMTCTGRSGLSRALLGSIADRVVRSCEAPVLLVHACGTLRLQKRSL